MLDIILNILSVIGIVLLILLALFLIVILLVLFFPITYRAYGKKKEETLNVRLKANWLFGLLRIRFFYPSPGNLTIKLLWFTLFDSASPETEKTQNKKSERAKEQSRTKTNNSHITQATSEKRNAEDTFESKKVNSGIPEAPNAPKQSIIDRIFSKYEKIKYTIQKLYGKIKHIAENISFYKELFEDKQTVELFRHVTYRLGRILKSIRPRKLKGDIVFGTGEPDTTGYVFGVYGMLSAWLGNPINVIPDFTQAILEGELYAEGHITIFRVLLHSLSIAFDKRLQLFVHRIQKHTL